MPAYYYADRDLLFVRVPKTASASIMAVLGKPSERLAAVDPARLGDSHLSFAVVRDPVARFASALGM